MKSLLTLVGISHLRFGAAQALQHLREGCPLLLIREPSNAYDPNAIQVWVRVGFIKKEQAAQLASKMDKNAFSDGVKPMEAVLRRNEGHYAELEIEEPEV